MEMPSTLTLAQQVVPIFGRLVMGWEAKSCGTLLPGEYWGLGATLQMLGHGLEACSDEQLVREEMIAASASLTDELERLIVTSEIRKAFGPMLSLHCAESDEHDHPNLKLLVRYAVAVPQRTGNVLQGKLLEERYDVLMTQLDQFCRMVVGEEEDCRISFVDENRRFHSQGLQFDGRGDLQRVLSENWPCKCGYDHEAKVGSFETAKLCLQPHWLYLGLDSGALQLVLQNRAGAAVQACQIKFRPSNCANCAARGPCPKACKIGISSADGMHLTFLAAKDRDPSGLCYVSFSESELEPPGIAHSTLHDLIERKIMLSMKERRILAVALANAILYLFERKRLQHSWSARDVSFYSFAVGGVHRPNYRRPYFTMDFRQQTNGINAHPAPAMVTLARVLLELERNDSGLGPVVGPRYSSDWAIANGLLREVTDSSGLSELDHFVCAMKNCLDPKTYDGFPAGTDEWMQGVYCEVLYHLEETLLQFCSSKNPRSEMVYLLFGRSDEGSARHVVEQATVQDSAPCHTGDSLPLGVLEAGSPGRQSDNWFRKLEKQTGQFMQMGREKSDAAKYTIKIAVLDTGVDLTHSRLRGKIDEKDCWDFVNGCERITDQVGHGTHTADLVLRTAPAARLFCGRVFKDREGNIDTTKHLENAIKHAVNVWRVDIITMSLAPYDTKNREGIEDALKRATRRDILLFAAASNDRHLEEVPIGFPAIDHNVICIFSERTPSFRSEFSPLGRESWNNFSVLGEEVEGAWISQAVGEHGTTKRQSGTSCATAIAAGVAALILEFSRHSGQKEVKNAQKLRVRAIMEKVLLECTDKAQGHEYKLLKPWTLLGALEYDKSAVSARLSYLIDKE